MEITLDKKNDCSTEMRAVVPAADVQNKKKSIIAHYSRNVRLAGFRPGKAPQAIIERRYAKEVSEQLHEELRSDAQSSLLEQHEGVKVLDFGAMNVRECEDGSCEITSTLTVVPPFELPEYMGIEVSVPSTEVSDEEVAGSLQRYAEASATFEPVERAAAKGDVVVMDFTTTVEGKPTAEYCGRTVGFMEGREGYRMALGEDTYIPELGEGLVGASVGDSREIVAKMSDTFPIKELQGKDVCFACTVKEVQEKRVPELTADLFASVLPGKTLDEVREEVRKNLQAGKERANEETKADQISRKLAEQLSFDLPEEMLERENENTMQRKIYAAIQAGDYESVKDTDAVRESCKGETADNLRVYFALLDIAEREHIVATDQEVMQSIAQMAKREGETNIKAFIRKLRKENRITGIRLSIITSKVIDLLVRNAKVTVGDAAPEAEQA